MNKEKTLNTHIERLEDISLQNVVGGVKTRALRIASESTCFLGLCNGALALVFQIASTVSRSKSKKALANGDIATSDKSSFDADFLNTASLCAGGLALAAFTTSAVTYKINKPLRLADSGTEDLIHDFELLWALGL